MADFGGPDAYPHSLGEDRLMKQLDLKPKKVAGPCWDMGIGCNRMWLWCKCWLMVSNVSIMFVMFQSCFNRLSWRRQPHWNNNTCTDLYALEAPIRLYIYIYFLCSPGARVFCPWPQIHPSLWWNPLLHGYHYSLVCTILISHCIGSKDVTSVTSFCISPINVAVKAQKKRVL